MLHGQSVVLQSGGRRVSMDPGVQCLDERHPVRRKAIALASIHGEDFAKNSIGDEIV